MRKIQKWENKKQVCGLIAKSEEKPEELTFLTWDEMTEYMLQAHPDFAIKCIYLNNHKGRRWNPIIRSLYCGSKHNCEVLTQAFTQRTFQHGILSEDILTSI